MIGLVSVTVENFQSYKAATCFTPAQEPGLYFLTGRNEIEPRLGPNGAGKSALFEAMFWCLFGALSDGSRGSQVVNETNNRPHVIVILQIDGSPHAIERFASPNLLLLDNNVVEQEAIDQLLGLSRQQFSQSVMFGQRSPMFYDLSVPHRGILLDDTLDLNLWQKCSEIAWKEELQLQKQQDAVLVKVAEVSGRISALDKERATLEEQLSIWKTNQENRITAAKTELASAQHRMESAREELDAARQTINKTPQARNIDLLHVDIDILKNKSARLRSAESEIRNGIAAVEATDQRITEANAKLLEMKQLRDKLKPPIPLEEMRSALEGHIGQLKDYQNAAKTSTETLHFYQNNKKCPTCHQIITSVFIHGQKQQLEETRDQAQLQIYTFSDHIALLRKQITEAEAHNEHVTKMLERIEINTKTSNEVLARENALADKFVAEVEKAAETQQTIGGSIQQFETEIAALLRAIDEGQTFNIDRAGVLERLQRTCAVAETVLKNETKNVSMFSDQIAALHAEDPYSLHLSQVVAQRADSYGQLLEHEARREYINGQIQACTFWKGAFKRVRLFVIKQITESLSIETTAVAAGLGLAGWRIEFKTELETKSGSVRSGVHLEITNPSGRVQLWSGGEEQRVRLAVSLGMAQMLQRMAGQKISFLILDEPTQHLGNEGVEDLVQILRNLASATNTMIWLIDHRTLDRGDFKETWSVVKDTSGSRLERI
jgi:DNA repair exonuclease SbcCD ATPase subunit